MRTDLDPHLYQFNVTRKCIYVWYEILIISALGYNATEVV